MQIPVSLHRARNKRYKQLPGRGIVHKFDEYLANKPVCLSYQYQRKLDWGAINRLYIHHLWTNHRWGDSGLLSFQTINWDCFETEYFPRLVDFCKLRLGNRYCAAKFEIVEILCVYIYMYWHMFIWKLFDIDHNTMTDSREDRINQKEEKLESSGNVVKHIGAITNSPQCRLQFQEILIFLQQEPGMIS